MTHGSLFSGIGGFDLAAEWMGWDNFFHCEINEFCNKVLKYYWPNAISYGNIKTTDFTIWGGQIDIISGGFPCQPFSTAGKRKGKEDDRYLWPEMLRAIREIQPRWIVGENVYGIVNWSRGMVFEQVQTDLENEGYKSQAYILPACGKNAPHRRDRTWFIANATNIQWDEKWKEGQQRRNGRESFGWVSGISREGVIADINSSRLERGVSARKYEGQAQQIQERGTIGKYIYENRTGIQFKNFPTQPPLCSGDDGLSEKLDGLSFSKLRTESIKAYGNAIVPQVAYEIFKTIEQFELLNKKENGKFSSV